MPAVVFEVAAPQCVAEDFDGEIVILNMDSGVYFSVRDAGAMLWRSLAAGHSVDALIGLTGGDAQVIGAINSFVDEIVREGLMRPATEPASPESAPTLDVALLARDAPTLEAFHDMQELLLLDPVHEVDAEIGWPKQPKA